LLHHSVFGESFLHDILDHLAIVNRADEFVDRGVLSLDNGLLLELGESNFRKHLFVIDVELSGPLLGSVNIISTLISCLLKFLIFFNTELKKQLLEDS